MTELSIMPMIGPIASLHLRALAFGKIHCSLSSFLSGKNFLTHCEIHSAKSISRGLLSFSYETTVRVLSWRLVYSVRTFEVDKALDRMESIWQIGLCALQTYFKMFRRTFKEEICVYLEARKF